MASKFASFESSILFGNSAQGSAEYTPSNNTLNMLPLDGSSATPLLTYPVVPHRDMHKVYIGDKCAFRVCRGGELIMYRRKGDDDDDDSTVDVEDSILILAEGKSSSNCSAQTPRSPLIKSSRLTSTRLTGSRFSVSDRAVAINKIQPAPTGSAHQETKKQQQEVLTLDDFTPMLIITGVESDILARQRVMAQIDSVFFTWRYRWFALLEGYPDHKDETRSFYFNLFSMFFVILSCTLFVVSTIPSLHSGSKNYPQAQLIIGWLEVICIIVFFFELLLRVITVPFRRFFNMFVIIDIVTILGYVIDRVVTDELSNVQSGAIVWSIMRMLRVLRIFKISRHSEDLQLVFSVLGRSARSLSQLVIPTMLVILVLSVLIYIMETTAATWDKLIRAWRSNDSGMPMPMQSIPACLYYAFTSATTVGYGDFVPSTLQTKITACVLLMFGVLALSFPNIVLGTNMQVAFRNKRKIRGNRKRLRTRCLRVMQTLGFIRWLQLLVTFRQKEIQRAENQVMSLSQSNVESPDRAGINYDDASQRSKKSGRNNKKINFNASRSETWKKKSKFGRNGVVMSIAARKASQAGVGTLMKSLTKASSTQNLTDNGSAKPSLYTIQILQILFQLFSGVATTREIYQNGFREHLQNFTVTEAVIVKISVTFVRAGLMVSFVLCSSVDPPVLLLALTQSAVNVLQSLVGIPTGKCHRSIRRSTDIWRDTSNKHIPYDLSPLKNIYSLWAEKEAAVEAKEQKEATEKALDSIMNNDFRGIASFYNTTTTTPVVSGSASTSTATSTSSNATTVTDLKLLFPNKGTVSPNLSETVANTTFSGTMMRRGSAVKYSRGLGCSLGLTRFGCVLPFSPRDGAPNNTSIYNHTIPSEMGSVLAAQHDALAVLSAIITPEDKPSNTERSRRSLYFEPLILENVKQSNSTS